MQKYTWPDLFKFMLLIFAGGVALTQDKVIFLSGVLASLVVWFINLYHSKTGTYLGKFWSTLILFVICVLSVFIARPEGVAIPAFPAWVGDPVAFITSLVDFLKQLVQDQSGVFAMAVGIYNLALAKILDNIAPRSAA